MTNTDKLIQAKVDEIRQVADLLPVVTIIHNLPKGFTVEYMSENGLAILQTSLEELQTMGTDYHSRFFNEKDAAYYVPKLRDLILKGNSNTAFTFFQQVRSGEAADWDWYLSATRILLSYPATQPLLTITQAIRIDPSSHLTQKVSHLLHDSLFFRDNYPLYHTLTRREKQVLALIAQAKTNKQIAEELFLSVNTVESHKKNLKAKLHTRDMAELMQFARAFDQTDEA